MGLFFRLHGIGFDQGYAGENIEYLLIQKRTKIIFTEEFFPLYLDDVNQSIKNKSLDDSEFFVLNKSADIKKEIPNVAKVTKGEIKEAIELVQNYFPHQEATKIWYDLASHIFEWRTPHEDSILF